MAQTTYADEVAGFSPEQLGAARRLVDRIARGRTEIARIEGEILRAMTELADIAHEAGREAPTSDAPEYTRRAMAAEVAAATRVHPQTARAQMEDAERITQDYPQTLRSLEQGCVSLSHARVIADAGRNLEPGARASLDACAVPFAETRTPGELRRITRKQAVDLQTSSPRERHEVARRDRRASLTELDDGMSELNVVAPTFEVRTLYDRLTTMARRVKMDRRRARSAFIREHGRTPEEMVAGPGYESPSGTPGESRRSSLSGDFSPSGNAAQAEGPTATRGSVGSVTQLTGLADGLARADVGASDVRTFDQLRADILCDLVLTAAPTGHELHASDTTEALRNVAANVQVTIPVEQLLDPDSGASWVDDGALISPQTACGRGRGTGLGPPVHPTGKRRGRRGRSLQTVFGTKTHAARTRYDVPVSRVHDDRATQRHRPFARLCPWRADRGREPQRALRVAPHRQARLRLDARAARRRADRVVQPAGIHLS